MGAAADRRRRYTSHGTDERDFDLLGTVEGIFCSVRPGRALALSHLPYRVASLALSTWRSDGAAYRPGESVEVTVRVSSSEEIR